MQDFAAGPSGRILIVDDTAIARTTLEALLALEGYHVLQAQDGPTGVELARIEQPDAIVLDAMMPSMDGFTVCTLLRADRKTARIPILMVTALSEAGARQRGMIVGVDDFLNKPFDRWELRARLGTLVRLGRAQQLLHERDRLLWVMERSETAYGLLDAADRVRYANAAFRRLVGLQPDAPLEMAFAPLLTDRLRVVDVEAWKRFDAWDELSGPITVVAPGVQGAPGRRIEIWAHTGQNPGGWRVVELRLASPVGTAAR